MKVAVIGLGVIGHVHLEVLAEMQQNVVAVCDVDESKFAEFPNAKPYTDYKKMIDEMRPDVVHVCTPHYLHAEMVIYALDNGVNVLCEKPLCISRDEIDEILAAEKRSSAQLGVVLQNRYNPANLYAKERLGAEKATNGYATMIWNRNESYYAQAEWRGTKSMEGGGVLINQALHTLDLMQWFCGEPDQVVASVNNFTLKHAIEVEDTASALYSGKANFTFFATNGSHRDFMPEVMLYTKDGYIRIMGDYVLENDELKYFNSTQKVYGKGCYGTGHGRLFAHFYDCVKKGEKFPINGEEGSKVIKMILATYESNGEKIDV
ncbi:MAG: Gfo/Idh/MocA family oxidoreductase [Clostridia bacterium]|nr:Gfo/Idh/MocA family oxidoreductase [Clostridia bacterium]MBQ8447054.1 Gfo/Idh/MocA family oxidoreductase [Clostridia bacterium]